MQKNIGRIDRTVRLSVGAILLALVYAGPARWWGLIGIVPILTASLSFCPLYTLLGIRRSP